MTSTLPRHLSPRRLTSSQRWTRIVRSSFAAHIRAAYDSALVWFTAAVVASVVVALLTRGQYVALDGLRDLPVTSGGAR